MKNGLLNSYLSVLFDDDYLKKFLSGIVGIALFTFSC